MHARGFLVSVLLVAPAAAGAWETDQLTDRDAPITDVTAQADAELQARIDQAITATNQRTGCRASDARTHRVLVREIARRAARDERVPDRGLAGGMGYNTYGAWLEQLPQAQRPAGREDIFGGLGFWQAPVLHVAGVCSTVGLAGQRVGVDKIDHFLEQGLAYWRRSRRGVDIDRAVAYGTRTERGQYGLMTSSAFSYADLEANLDGLRFYAGLLGPDGVATRGADGCLVAAKPFSWADWVDWRYDEVLNPSVYTSAAANGIIERLSERREEVCAAYAEWGTGYHEWLDQVLASSSAAAGERAPARVDPYQLDQLCGSVASAGHQGS